MDGKIQTRNVEAGYAGTSAGSTVDESMPDIRRLGTSRGAEVGRGLTANSSSRSEIENWLRGNGVL